MKIAADVLSQGSISQQPDRLERYAGIIRNQTEHLQGQVRTPAADRFHRDQGPAHPERGDRPAAADRAGARKGPAAYRTKKARIELKIEDSEGKGQLHADRAHLELAVINLLENALKYSAEPHIVVETGSLEDDFFISVKDNGVGIEKQYLKNIFKKFYRVPTGDIHDVKGFGLGLNFVKRIIDAHKGRIKVNSLPGIGTEFRLFIPFN